MVGQEAKEINAALGRISKTCNAISLICLAVFGLFGIFWTVELFSSVFELVSEGTNDIGLMIFFDTLVNGAGIILLLLVAFIFFKQAAHGNTPFSAKQIKRIRIAGIVLLIIALFQCFLSLYYSYDAILFDLKAGFIVDAIFNETFIEYDLVTLALGLFLFGLSVMFEYGMLLQRLSDETA